jgi:hypothetical protein
MLPKVKRGEMVEIETGAFSAVFGPLRDLTACSAEDKAVLDAVLERLNESETSIASTSARARSLTFPTVSASGDRRASGARSARKAPSDRSGGAWSKGQRVVKLL